MQERGDTNEPLRRLQILKTGEWHLPLVTEEEKAKWGEESLKRISAARCARTSYTLIEGGLTTDEKDLLLGSKLVTADPLHATPCEHQARSQQHSRRYGNFKSFKQFRFEIAGERGGDEL
jgi:hypothetical protein